jgi:heptosyltransferase II
VKRVLILTKHRFLGDTIVAVPLLRAVRECYPEAEISLLTGTGAAQILENCPYLDAIRTYEPGSNARTRQGEWRLLRSLWKEMRQVREAHRPDLVILSDRSFRSAMGALWSGSKTRVGFDTEGRGHLLTHKVAYDRERLEVECNLDLLRALGQSHREFFSRPELFVTEAECSLGQKKLWQGDGGGCFIGMQPGASHAYKNWPIERFAIVAETLLKKHKAQLVLLGGPEEKAAAEALQALLPAQQKTILDLTGKTTLRETMGVLSQLRLFVGNDTGVSHIAAALGTPTVTIFGPTPATKWGNSGPKNLIIAAKNQDIRLITNEEVLLAAESLL